MPELASRLGGGAIAGLAGAAAMTVSTAVEMKLRGRPPSRAPIEVAERLLDIEAGESEWRIGTVGHLGSGVAAGAVAAAAGGSAPSFFAVAMLPEIVVVPALSSADPPWRWPASEWFLSALHHAVFAAAATRCYARTRSGA